jgi:hypothetical protein
MHGHGHDDHAQDTKGGYVKPVAREHDFLEKLYVPAIATGLTVTVRHFFKNLLSKDRSTRPPSSTRT